MHCIYVCVLCVCTVCTMCTVCMCVYCVYVLCVQVCCQQRHPPGEEIYRKGHISVFEVDGEKHKVSKSWNSLCWVLPQSTYGAHSAAILPKPVSSG